MAIVRRRRSAEADPDPVLPEELAYLWLVWRELNAARSCGMAANPISWTEIEAYQRVTGEPLSAWEARVIRTVDNAYMAAQAGSGGQ